MTTEKKAPKEVKIVKGMTCWCNWHGTEKPECLGTVVGTSGKCKFDQGIIYKVKNADGEIIERCSKGDFTWRPAKKTAKKTP